MGTGQKSELLEKDDPQAWCRNNCRTTQYSFQIKKFKQAPPSEACKEQALGAIQSQVECLPLHIQQLVNSAIRRVKGMQGLVMLLQGVRAGSFGVDVWYRPQQTATETRSPLIALIKKQL